MVDSSYFLAFPTENGRLMSAAKCHDGGKGQLRADQIYMARMRQLMGYSDRQIAEHAVDPTLPPSIRDQKITQTADRTRKWLQAEIDDYYKKHLWVFGVLNYPLPR